ncbi:aspartate--tRNA(Asn) ligase [Clostridium sp.]
MERLLAEKLYYHKEETVKIKGWIHRIRKMGKIAFLIIRDRSGLVQCVVDTKAIDIKGLKLESVVEVLGVVKERNAETKEIELLVQTLNIISLVTEDLPVEINKEDLDVNIDTLLNNRVLTLRHLKTNAIFKIQAALAQGFAEFLKNMDFTQVYSPKIVAEGTEGGTGLFEVKYFEKKAYLAQSPQFYKQMLVGAGYERVFEIGHVYRAEEHNTIRHLNEYVSMDLEMGFIEDEKDIMNLETKLLKYIFKYVISHCTKELNLLNVNFPEIGEQIPSMKLSDAIEILKTKYGKTELENDLDPEGEKFICEYVKEKYDSDFIFLTHYPRSKRPMYTMPEGSASTHSFDLLFRGVEITTGGQRIHNYQQLKESISSKGLDLESFSGYLQVFKYGIPPHGGLAIGLERLTAQLLGLRNVREVTLFPRDRDRIAP